MKSEELFQFELNNKTDINEHIMLLSTLSTNKKVVEFGVRNGSSTIGLLYGRPISLDSYDLNECGRIEDITIMAEELNVKFNFHIGDSRKIDIDNADILFIDTLHTEEQLITELNLHADKISEKIIMHDTSTFGINGEGGEGGLICAIETFLDNNPQWKIEKIYTNNNGLTVLRRVNQ